MQPMLASPAKEIRFPVMASPKIDGIRCYIKSGVALSRSGKPIRNRHVQSLLGKGVLDGLDGELCVGHPWDKDLMQKTTSGVMSADGEPDFCYYVFDVWTQDRLPYEERYSMLTLRENRLSYPAELHNKGQLRFLEHVVIRDQIQLDKFELRCTTEGYEGIMVRDPKGLYKYGRSTAKEGGLLKVKRWADGEARILEFQEKMHNANELQQDEYGYAKRSSHQENMVPMGTLGALVCEDLKTGTKIKIGTGFDDLIRKAIWKHQFYHKDKIVKYKHFAQTGVKDTSRFPVFVGFRDKDDM